ncbi:MAG: hypothetical protein RL443_962, partial [Actinomycetota bacterium]
NKYIDLLTFKTQLKNVLSTLLCAKKSQLNVLLFFRFDIKKGFNNLSLFIK